MSSARVPALREGRAAGAVRPSETEELDRTLEATLSSRIFSLRGRKLREEQRLTGSQSHRKWQQHLDQNLGLPFPDSKSTCRTKKEVGGRV